MCISFSHERNTNEAKRIIAAIEKRHNTPDFYLLKAQIAQYEGDSVEVDKNTIAYLTMLKSQNYGAMYNKYNVLLFADKKETAPKALEIAQNHVVGKSFEPRVQYHLARIYKSNNLSEKIQPIKEELLKSTYELGPNLENKIAKL